MTPPAARTGPEDVAAPRAPRPPWATVALALAVVAAAHVALYLVLTVTPRGEMRRIEAAHGTDALASAREPGPQPPPGAAFAEWAERRERWEDARAHERHAHHVRMIAWALTASFLLQTAVASVLIVGLTRRRRPRR